MKEQQVKIGQVYKTKIGRNIVGVRVMKENPEGGWDTVSIKNGTEILIKTATRLLGLWNPKEQKTGESAGDKTKPAAQGGKESKEATKPTNSGKKRDTTQGGGLSAAVKVLAEAKEPLNCKQLVERMLEKGYWQTSGKTPSATIYSAIIRQIKEKGADADFRKVERGKFALAK